eukprot:g8402.t1
MIEPGHRGLEWLSVVVVQDGESMNVLGIRIGVEQGNGRLIYYFPLEEVSTWARRTRTLLLGNEFNQTHFAHLEHNVEDELEDSANVGEYNPEDYGQEVEQIVQLEQDQDVQPFDEVEQEQEEEVEPHQVVQLVDEVEQEEEEVEEDPHQVVQLAGEVEQENQIQVAQPVFGGLENLPQQQIGVVEGVAEGMVVVEEIPDAFGEQENVNPNIMGAPIAFVGIPVQEGVALGILQEQVVNIQEPQPILPPQEINEIVPIDNDNGGLEVEEVEEFEIQVVEVDGDGDVVMVDAHIDVDEGVGVEEGVVQGIGVQEPQIGHRYPLRDTRARRQFREREQQRRDRAGERGDRGRRVRRRFG